MKNVVVVFVIANLLFSCKQSSTDQAQKREMPNALQENESFEVGYSSGGREDLVDALYNELASKTPALKEFSKNTDNLLATKRDSTESYYKYKSKNESYYHSAYDYISQIKDTVLRQRMTAIVKKSFDQYNKNTTVYKRLDSLLNERDSSLQQLYMAIKISKTLPLIEGFQRKSAPSVKPIENAVKAFDKQIKKGEHLIKE